MRLRSIRLTIVILLILAISLAALGFRTINIDLPGFPALLRDGSGPLGLKLGLDLRGGGHLVYQADTGTRFDVTFVAPADYSVVQSAMSEIRLGEEELALDDFQLAPRDLTLIEREVEVPTPEAPTPEAPAGQEGDAPDAEAETDAAAEEQAEEPAEPQIQLVPVLTQAQISAPLLASEDPRRSGLRAALEEAVGEILLFQTSDIGNPTPDQMAGVLDNISRRVNRFGTEEPIIQIFGEDRIIVQLPGASGSTTDIIFVEPVTEPELVEAMRASLEGAGYEDMAIERRSPEEFRISSNTVGADIQTAARQSINDAVGAVQLFQVVSAIDRAKQLIGQTALLEFKERTCQTLACAVFTDADLGLSGDDLVRAEAGADAVGANWVVNLQFNDRGAEIFSDLTRRIQNVETKRIAVFMDDEPIIAPVARGWIRDGRTEISGNFRREEARTLSIQLESGRLQVPLKLIQESDVDALLGAESLRNSLLAGLVGLGLVLVFMVVYYRAAGVVAAGALIFYAVIVLAVFKLIPITLELAHIGGFILSVGMAVDANILIFERMKEEVRIGRTLASSMEVGFSRAWPAIRDSNVSTMITCLVLMWFGDRLGGGLVTGVAISLFIGVAISMFTAVVVSRNLLQLMAWIGLGHRINLFTPEPLQPRERSAPQTTGGGR